jgi:hypothetical protein
MVISFMEILELGNSLGCHWQLQDRQHALGDNVPRHPLHEQLRRLHSWYSQLPWLVGIG